MQTERIQKIKTILLTALIAGLLGSFWLFIVFWFTANVSVGFFIAISTLGEVLFGTALLVALFSLLLDRLPMQKQIKSSKIVQSLMLTTLIFSLVSTWILLDMFVINADNYQKFTLSNIQYSFADSFLGYIPVMLSHTFAIPKIYDSFKAKQ